MKKNGKIKYEWRYLATLLLIFIIGCIHTSYAAYSLYNCESCSAPYSLAFIFPGGLYLILLGILVTIYYFIRKKYFFAIGLLICLLGLIAIIALRLLEIL